ncbi:hypothetical protein LXA43DRAFT_593736 [Ganoderma leucocontextum]|nr:hypothetical protein LXA43DRAFT_593736 [Ganoderma leucocontextum]
MAGDGPEESPRVSRKLPSLLNSVGKVTLPQYRAQSILDIAGRVVQAESVDEFLDELLPYPASRKRALRIPKRPRVNTSNNPFRSLEKAGKMSEDKVVRLFAAAVKKHKLTPGMGLGRCQHKPDKRKRTRKRQGGEDVPKVDMMRQKVDAAFFREQHVPKDGRPHWSGQTLPVEFKGGKLGVALDAFENQDTDTTEEQGDLDVEEQDEDDVEEEEEVEGLLDIEELDEARGSDNGDGDDDETDEDEDEYDEEESPKLTTPPLEPRATTRKEVRGQITTYSELLQLIQHRVALFMLLILGRRFRLLRWDRAGVIVTKSIDYFKDPDPLCDFLWRISHLSDAALGFDPSAIRLFDSDPEWADMTQRAIALESDLDSTPRVLTLDELPLPGPAVERPYFVFDYVRKMFAESIADSRWPRFKLRVSANWGKTRDFLVGKPVFSANGAVGRATRGYVAVDCQTGRFVWLKDSWRAAYEGVEQEGLILQRLNAEPKIKDVPTLVCHGDVFGQRTITADWWERQNPLSLSSDAAGTSGTRGKKADTVAPVPLEPAQTVTAGPRGVKRERGDDLQEPFASPVDDVSDFRKDSLIRHHKHYRLVVEEVGMPLKKFLTLHQLVQILLDCLCTHKLAATCDNLQILHRDISDANVIILPKLVTTVDGQSVLNWTGILTDWENSKPMNMQPQARPRQPEHTGNWQFTSVNLLNHPKGVKIPDELESIFLILVYYCIRYSMSSIPSREAVAGLLDECFDCFTLQDGKLMCGERKDALMREGKFSYYRPQFGLQRITFNGSPLDHLISESLKRFSAKYKPVTTYDTWVAQNPEEVETVPSLPIVRNGVQLVYVVDNHAVLDDDPQAGGFEAALGPPPEASASIHQRQTKPPEPTPEERALAANVWGHNWMCWMFRRSLKTAGWEKVVRVKRDRVPKGWVSPHPTIPCDSSLGHSNAMVKGSK